MLHIKQLTVAVACLWAATAMAKGDVRPPITLPLVHDPVLAYENGTYHVFSTGHYITELTSTDLRSWRLAEGGVLEGHLPAWTRDSVPGFNTHVWAPDVVRYRDRWYMAYSCSTFGKNTSAIGLASANSLDRPAAWRDEGCIITSRGGRDNWNAIDPNFVFDRQGQPWLSYGSFWDGIQLVPLDTTLHILPGSRPVTIARRHLPGTVARQNPTSKDAGTNAIEAPFIFQRKGWYYLFVSHDYCCQGLKSDYHVVVGRSRNITGPYLDREGRRLDEGGGTMVFGGDGKVFEAAGHCSVYRVPRPGSNGRRWADYFLCHGYSIAQEGMPQLVVKGIKWKRGWPTLVDL